MKKLYGLLCAVLVLASCAANKEVSTDLSADDLYNQAFEELEKTRYQKAAEIFEMVETEHPYSKWAVKAKLMGAYAYYKDEKYDDAVLALDRFIKYHPGNKDAAYAYYLKGMCYYDQISDAEREQSDTQMAEETFSRLVMLYPNSKYAEDAKKKIDLTNDYKAGQEMVIGRFYLKQGNYLSALNRFNVVLENYQTTVQIEEALYRQVEIYAILGMNKYAKGYYEILAKNYPEGEWTKRASEVMEKISETKDKKQKETKEEVAIEEKSNSSWFDKLKFWSKGDVTENDKVVATANEEKGKK